MVLVKKTVRLKSASRGLLGRLRERERERGPDCNKFTETGQRSALLKLTQEESEQCEVDDNIAQDVQDASSKRDRVSQTQNNGKGERGQDDSDCDEDRKLKCREIS